MKIRRTAVALGSVALFFLALAACGGNPAGNGQVSIVLSSSGGTLASAPAGTLATGAATASTASTLDHGCPVPQAANVTFSSILARTLEGKLVAVTIDLPVTVDLLSLGNGNVATLPVGFLPPGTYDQFVVVMTQVEMRLADGTKIGVTPPGGGWTAIVPVEQPFTVAEGKMTSVTLNFRRDLSFRCGLGTWEFHPQFECQRSHDGRH